MKKKIWLMVLCGVLVMGGSLTALAVPWERDGKADVTSPGNGPCRMEARRGHWERLAESLDLSKKQRQEAKKLFEANREQAEKVHAEIKETDRELRLASNPKNFDEKALRKLAAEKAQLHAELMVSRARIRRQVYALLTPEQQELADLAYKLKQLRGPHPKKRRGGPDGSEGFGPRFDMQESGN